MGPRGGDPVRPLRPTPVERAPLLREGDRSMTMSQQPNTGDAGSVQGPADFVPFDLAGPLPSGVTLLEASAGTGKTFAIAALVARYVAEGTPLDRLLVITFTRNATGELRERVRERLVGAADCLSDILGGVPVDATDDVL